MSLAEMHAPTNWPLDHKSQRWLMGRWGETFDDVPLHLEDRRTHFGSIKTSTKPLLCFLVKFEWNAANKTPANAGMDLTGMCQMVLQ